MKRKIRGIAKNMAYQEGYDNVKYLNKWHEYDVFEPIYNDNEIRITGYPIFILHKDGKFRWSEYEEGVQIMDKLFE